MNKTLPVKKAIIFPKFKERKPEMLFARAYTRRTIITWLRALFNQMEWLEKYQWVQDEKQTKIWISYDFPTKHMIKVPQIAVKATPLTYESVGLGQYFGDQYKSEYGTRFTLSIGIRTYNQRETENIADAVWMFVTERDLIELLMERKHILVDLATVPRISGLTTIPVGETKRYEDTITIGIFCLIQFRRDKVFTPWIVKNIGLTMERVDCEFE